MDYNLGMFKTFEDIRVLRFVEYSNKQRVLRFVEYSNKQVENPSGIICLYCGVRYETVESVRDDTPCMACLGVAKYANQINTILVNELESAIRRSDRNRLVEIAELVPPETYFYRAAKATLESLQ